MPRRSRRAGVMMVTTAVLVAGSIASADATGRDAPAVEAGRFRALSYNVAGLPEPLSSSDSDINSPLISPLLNGYELVLLQEDWVDPDPPIAGVDFHHDDIVSAVTHPYRSIPAPPPLGTDPRRPGALVADGLNLLSVFPFGEVRRVMWDGCFGGIDTGDGGAGDCLSQKGFMVTTVSLAPGIEVDVYNLHAEAGATRTDQDLSAAQFDQLAEFITVNSVGRAVIVGGDTNLHTDDTHPDSWGEDGSIWRRFLERAGLQDVCDVVRCGDDADSIDKFAFRSGGGLTLEARSHRFERDVFVRTTDGRPLSDHDALRVEFSWRALRPSTTTTVAATAPPPAPATAAVTVPRLTG